MARRKTRSHVSGRAYWQPIIHCGRQPRPSFTLLDCFRLLVCLFFQPQLAKCQNVLHERISRERKSWVQSSLPKVYTTTTSLPFGVPVLKDEVLIRILCLKQHPPAPAPPPPPPNPHYDQYDRSRKIEEGESGPGMICKAPLALIQMSRSTQKLAW